MCLDNLIGLRDHNGEELIPSDTGYFINDLPGVEFGSLTQGINSEAANAQVEIERQIALAQKLVTARLRESLSSNIKAYSLLENKQVGIWNETRTAQAAQAYKVGVRLHLRGNPDAVIRINRISMLTSYDGAIDVKAWDLYTGEELKSETITASSSGVVTADVDWSFPANGNSLNIFIGYDATSVGSYQTKLSQSGCSTCKGGYVNWDHLQVYSRKVSGDVLHGNLENQSGTSGLSLSVSVGCEFDHFLCSVRSSIAPAMLYKTAELLMGVLKYSKRLSPSVIVFENDHEELAEKYSEEYEKTYNDFLKNVRLPKGDCWCAKTRTGVRVSI